MKFIVKQADLKEALNKLVRITSKQIPVYKNIRVEKLSNDRLLLSSTNGILSMQIKLPAIDIEGEYDTMTVIRSCQDDELAESTGLFVSKINIDQNSIYTIVIK